MAHHSDTPMSNFDFNKAVQDQKLGATGKFPEGKIDEHDEGEIKIGVTVKDDKIIIAFGKKIEWIGFTKKQAEDLANTILQRARQI